MAPGPHKLLHDLADLLEGIGIYCNAGRNLDVWDTHVMAAGRDIAASLGAGPDAWWYERAAALHAHADALAKPALPDGWLWDEEPWEWVGDEPIVHAAAQVGPNAGLVAVTSAGDIVLIGRLTHAPVGVVRPLLARLEVTS